jgi:preprotein translocase subunit SecD
MKTTDDYQNFLKNLGPMQTIMIRTNKGLYKVEVVNGTDIGLRVYNKPKNNLKAGLDISGGTRVLLKPIVPENKTATVDDFNLIKENINKRLNVYGLSDTTIRVINDKPAILGGKPTYISVEISGANENEISSLISNQGKFEATISNQTVFYGGKDIANICRSATCSGINFNNPCGALNDGSGLTVCRFFFQISLSQNAAEKFANLTKNLDVLTESNGEKILSEHIVFYLDGTQTDSLSISGSLKGQVATDVQITGSGTGKTQDEAMQNALTQMKEMQSVLSTGSLPYKLSIVNTNLISPTLGSNFLKNTILVAIIAVCAVAVMIFLRYRIPIIVIPIIVTLCAEIFLLLGMAALIGSTLDLAAIAGIIVTIGTGTNDQIVIIDETIKNRHKRGTEVSGSFLSNLKGAFFIIFSAYATIVVAMIPLLFAGAGLLQGFAIITILGASFGVFVTRPAFSKMIEILMNK